VETEAKQYGGILKIEMPYLLLDEKKMLYKTTSGYTAKFLAGHYVVSKDLLSGHVGPGSQGGA
jgi:hypothetical protein